MSDRRDDTQQAREATVREALRLFKHHWLDRDPEADFDALVAERDRYETMRQAAERYADLELRACGDPCMCGSAECELVLALAGLREGA